MRRARHSVETPLDRGWREKNIRSAWWGEVSQNVYCVQKTHYHILGNHAGRHKFTISATRHLFGFAAGLPVVFCRENPVRFNAQP
jgi:hypothetical protein